MARTRSAASRVVQPLPFQPLAGRDRVLGDDDVRGACATDKVHAVDRRGLRFAFRVHARMDQRCGERLG